MYTQDLYAQLSGGAFDLVGPDGRIYPTRVAKLPVIQAIPPGPLFVMQGSLNNPYGTGPAVLDLDRQPAVVPPDTVLKIVSAVPLTEMTPVRIITRADLNRRLADPREEAAILVALGATDTGSALATSLGMAKVTRITRDAAGTTGVRCMEIIVTLQAQTAALSNALSEGRAPRGEDGGASYPSLADVLAYVKRTGRMPAPN